MTSWDFDVSAGLGPLTPHMTQADLVAWLGKPTDTFEKASVDVPVLVWGSWLHVYLTKSATVQAVEVFPPAQVVWQGVPLVSVPPRGLVGELEAAGFHPTAQDDGEIQYLDGLVSLVVVDEADSGPVTDCFVVDWACGGARG